MSDKGINQMGVAFVGQTEFNDFRSG